MEELSGSGPEPVDAKRGPTIGRLTILVHAAPLSPNLSSLQPDDVQRVVDSLSSLLRELPAQSVRLIAFNLDQRAVIFREDGFEVNQSGELTAALNQLELGLLDYKVMRDRPAPVDLLLGLAQAELRDPKPLWPRTRMHDDVRPDALGMHLAGTIPVFDLQLQFNRPLLPGQGPNSRVSAPDAMTRPGPQMTAAPNSQGTFMAAEDTIERLVTQNGFAWNGANN